MNFFVKFFRYFVLFFIFFFSFVSIFISSIAPDIKDERFQKILGFTNFFENQFYDLRMRRTLNPNFKDPNIVLIKIDDYSLQKFKTYPLPRTVYAKMLDQLQNFGAKVVAFDITFPEKAPVCGEDSPDDALIKSIKNFNQSGKAIMSYTLANADEDPMRELPDSLLNFLIDSKEEAEAKLLPMYVSQYNFPFKELADSGIGLAHISMEEDLDGIFRNYRIVTNIDSMYFPSLALSTYESFTGSSVPLEIFNRGTAQMNFDSHILDIESRGTIKIRFKGGTEQFASAPLYDVIMANLDDKKMHELFKNKIVFVGSTATGAHDLRPTALDTKLPGVYTHMNIVHMLINKYFFIPSNVSIKYSLIFLTVGTLLLHLVQYFGFALLDLATLAFLVVASFLFDEQFLMNEGYELKLFYCYLSFTLTYALNTFINFIKASQEKKQIKGTFARYVSPQVVNDMLDHPDKLKVGGEKKEITCFFSDVRDFTSISEKMTATELSLAMNTYLGAMTDIIFEYYGTLDKYIGDAIVAIWGAPLEVENHPQKAVEATIKMMERLPVINQEFKAKGWPEFKVGCGINTGECSVGNMGSEKIFSYTALGDNMNLGARLEGLSKNYNAQIIISEYTLDKLNLEKIKVRPLDRVQVKGKLVPVKIFEVLFQGHPLWDKDDLRETYFRAYEDFVNKNFEDALVGFLSVTKDVDDIPSARIIQLIKLYQKEGLPQGFDHDVTVMTTK